MSGRLIVVVGPSGVGKDSVIAGLTRARPDLHRVRRAITRDPDAGGEPFEPLDDAAFAARRDAGGFVLHWQAHGLRYGIPRRMARVLATGGDAIVNLSRRVLPEAARRFAPMTVIALEASPETLARRLRGRGREEAGDIAARLARDATLPDLPPVVRVIRLCNDGPLDATIAAAQAALYPVGQPL